LKIKITHFPGRASSLLPVRPGPRTARRSPFPVVAEVTRL